MSLAFSNTCGVPVLALQMLRELVEIGYENYRAEKLDFYIMFAAAAGAQSQDEPAIG